MSTTCNGTFKIDTGIPEHLVNLFLFNMTLLLQGRLVEGSPTKILERDATLKNIMKVGACEQTIYGEVQGKLNFYFKILPLDGNHLKFS